MAIYAGLGVAQALIFFFMGASFSVLAYFASRALYRVSLLPSSDWMMSDFTSGCYQARNARPYVLL